jgi:hypothetical protein
VVPAEKNLPVHRCAEIDNYPISKYFDSQLYFFSIFYKFLFRNGVDFERVDFQKKLAVIQGPTMRQGQVSATEF